MFSKLSFFSVFHTTFSRDYLVGDSIVRSFQSEIKIGFDCDNLNQSKFHKLISNNWYTRLISSQNRGMFEMNRNNEFLINLGIDLYPKKYILPKLPICLDSMPAKEFIVICPGASKPDRCWSAKKFSKLIDQLSDKYNFLIFLCGSKNDLKQSEVIIKNSKSKKIKNFIGKTNLMQLIEILRKSKFNIANDSAPIHISYALDIPSICISGGNNFGRFVPYPNKLKNAPKTIFNKECLSNDFSVDRVGYYIDKITVKEVSDLFDMNYKI